MGGVTTAALASAYDRTAAAWARGPDRLYGELAARLVDTCPPLAGRRVLDVGAGTGAVTRTVEAAGGTVVASDLSPGMLADRRVARPPAVAADARCLPFGDSTFDAVLASFVLNHIDEPVTAVREAARVTRTGGTFAASTFHPDWSHPAKRAVDAVASRHGWRPPPWYLALKAQLASSDARTAALRRAARDAGLVGVAVVTRTVDGGLRTAEDIAAWRLGMAHVAPFVTSLSGSHRRCLVAEAVAAVGPRPEPVRPRVVLLRAVVP